jgi:uncharacterized protein (DUF433 family)
MNQTISPYKTVIRERGGLFIAGTRITLYDIMDYVLEGWSPQRIQSWFNLTNEQIRDALCYIEENRAEVEAEYQSVLEYAEEIRQYWEERNKERFAQIAAMPRKPGQEELWAKLDAQKRRLELEEDDNHLG